MSEYVSIGNEGFGNFTSADYNDPIDLTASAHLLQISTIDPSTKTWSQPAEDSTGIPAFLVYTTLDIDQQPIDFVTSTNEQIIAWPKNLFVEKTGVWIQQQSYSVVPGNRFVYTIDFASRTSFNTDNDLSFDPPQYWIGA